MLKKKKNSYNLRFMTDLSPFRVIKSPDRDYTIIFKPIITSEA